MNKLLAIVALVSGLSGWSTAYADTAHEGDRCEYKSSARHQLLGRLPAEKEVLFHRTMREARKQMDGIREDVVKAREEARSVLLASEFNESLFKEKTAKIHELVQREHQVMEGAIATLAKQYTPEERKLLAEVLATGKSHRRWASHRHMM